MKKFLVVIDTPGIKQFVFGTDTLAEVRGASALLDRLNRVETERCLREALEGGEVKKVFANGGTGRFEVSARDEEEVRAAVDKLSAYYRQETGGEVCPIVAVVSLEEADTADYGRAVFMAFAEMKERRNLGSGRPTIPTLPFVLECESTSHLPAASWMSWGGERLLLSEASRRKREEARRIRQGGLWSGWIEHLRLPNLAGEETGVLRCENAEEIGEYGGKRGYIGLIYADGNAMGRLVQELPSSEVCAAFSELVDGSIRQACYEALDEVCRGEIEHLRQAFEAGSRPTRLPADILLLGGDDLLVLLPADRALTFALRVTDLFERMTRERVEGLSSGPRQFFEDRVGSRGLTISCGVALGPAKYPFYLLLDLAEDLLKSAKRGGCAEKERMEPKEREEYWSPSYIDFHLVAGSASPELAAIREEDYRVCRGEVPRTMRPYRREHLERLREAVQRLQVAQLPRSKLQALFEAALEPREKQAQRRAEELFGRLREDNRHQERRGLWEALSMLGSLTPYPWTKKNGQRTTALADLVEVSDLFANGEKR